MLDAEIVDEPEPVSEPASDEELRASVIGRIVREQPADAELTSTQIGEAVGWITDSTEDSERRRIGTRIGRLLNPVVTPKRRSNGRFYSVSAMATVAKSWLDEATNE